MKRALLSGKDMICTTYENPGDFLNVCRPALEASEAKHSLMLGVALRLVGNPRFYGDSPMLATVADDDQLVLAALMTPPYVLQLALFEPSAIAAVKLVAQVLQRREWPVPGVLGEEETINAFANNWCQLTGAKSEPGMRQRIYELREVTPIKMAPGSFRQATDEDLSLLIAWSHAFHVDCFDDDDHPELGEAAIRKMAESGSFFFWCDPVPVAMAAVTRPTTHGITVSYVYTPPESRGRGYASAVVARLSRRCLDEGKEFCALYTDLSNPTSNSIYQRIGYRPIGDVADVHFR